MMNITTFYSAVIKCKLKLLLLLLLATPHGLQDLSPLTGDQTCAPEVEMQNPNHWTTREFTKLEL